MGLRVNDDVIFTPEELKIIREDMEERARQDATTKPKIEELKHYTRQCMTNDWLNGKFTSETFRDWIKAKRETDHNIEKAIIEEE
jgi:hypothetical protein